MKKFGSLHWITLAIWSVSIALCGGSYLYADYLYQRDISIAREKINTENSNVARSLSHSIQGTFSWADEILLFMQRDFEASNMVDPAHLELMKTFRTRGLIDQIAIADKNGELLFSAVPLQSALNIADREHFSVHEKANVGQAFISTPRVSQATGNTNIFLSRRLNGPNGEFAGTVSIGLNEKLFMEQFRQSESNPEKSIVLLRTDGNFLARAPKPKTIEHQEYFKTHVVFTYLQQGISVGYYEAPGFEDGPRLAAFKVVPDFPVVILVASVKEIALKEVYERREIYQRSAGVFSLLLLSALLLVTLLKRQKDSTALALTLEHKKAIQYLSQMEQQKVEVEMARLDRLNLIGQMAASLGHEVRNPLTTVRGYLQLFQRRKEYKQHIDQFALMIGELDRASSIITEFLSLAKNKRVNLVSTTFNEIILQMLPLLRADALLESKEISLEFHSSLPVQVDTNEIRQLIINLVRNGLDAMNPGGVITIALFVEGNYIVLKVKDTGTGIAPDVLAKLGTPFMTTKEKGTGLGLVVCYKIVERHKATMDVATSAAGTTFSIRFPLLDTQRESI